jgi:DeoR/GlpR family transcriptional regulator of sugar metabolism
LFFFPSASRAQRVIVPIDHTKIGIVDFALVCALNAIDVVVTDQENTYLQKWCSSHNIRLVVASPTETTKEVSKNARLM